MSDDVDERLDEGHAHLALGELEEAVACYRACVEADPECFDGWHALGMAQMKLGRFPEAIAAGERAVALRPNDQLGWSSLSLFYVRAGEIKKAEDAGAKARILSWGGKVVKDDGSRPLDDLKKS
ncbi:MAG: tetratricopeptide repeat protein [Verrucomicrobia bacterium]|nr:tetratricopeptide repeat protein [Verrucomicrobiota bacterium]